MKSALQLSLIAMLSIIFCGKAQSQTPVVKAENALLASVNEARRAEGLPELRWNESLAKAAIRHAEVMAEQGTAQHGFEGEPDLRSRAKQAGARFSSLSENVTQGPTPEFIHGQFMHSPPHRANILDTDMNSVGIGVIEKHGQLFAVEDFSRTQ
jgi:uncharacterized protein YkwD